MADNSLDPLELYSTRNNEFPGLSGLFSMVDFFLHDVIQLVTIDDVMESNGIDSLTDIDKADLTSWLSLTVGYIVCSLISLIFIILLPATCCCCCCSCRCCRCCCCKEDSAAKPASSCYKICCSTLLAMLSAVMLATASLSIVFITIVEPEVSEGGTLTYMNNSLLKVDGYLDVVVNDVDDVVVSPMTSFRKEFFIYLDGVPQQIANDIDTNTQANSLLNYYVYAAESLAPLQAELTVMQTSVDNLVVLTESLNDTLTRIRLDIEDNCVGEPACAAALAALPLLTVNASYDTIANLTTTIDVITAAIDSNITDAAHNALDQYEQLEDDIAAILEPQMTQLNDAVMRTENSINNTFDAITEFVNGIDFASIYTRLGTMEENVATYSPYVTVSLYVICSVLLTIGVLQCVGLTLSWIGLKKRMKVIGHGTNILVASVVLVLVFSWITTIFITVAFVGGGLAENMVCQSLTGQSYFGKNIINDILRNNGSNATADVNKLLEACQKDSAIYEASSIIEYKYNLTELLDLNQYGIYDIYHELQNKGVDDFNKTFITEETNTTLYALDNVLDAIDFSAYYDVLQQPITNIELDVYAALLDSTALNVTDPDVAANLTALADELRVVDSTLVVNIEQERQALNSSTVAAEALAGTLQFDTLAQNLTEMQTNVNTQADDIVEAALDEQSTIALQFLENATYKVDQAVRTDVGNCRELYVGLVGAVHAPCTWLLGSFNGLWFSLGWYVSFALPAAIFATYLARKFSIDYEDIKKDPPKSKKQPVASNAVAPAPDAASTDAATTTDAAATTTAAAPAAAATGAAAAGVAVTSGAAVVVVTTAEPGDSSKLEEQQAETLKAAKVLTIAELTAGLRETLDELIEARLRSYSPFQRLEAFLLRRNTRVSPMSWDTQPTTPQVTSTF